MWSLIFPPEKFVETGCLVIKRTNYDLTLLSAAATIFLKRFFFVENWTILRNFFRNSASSSPQVGKNSFFSIFLYLVENFLSVKKTKDMAPGNTRYFFGKKIPAGKFFWGLSQLVSMLHVALKILYILEFKIYIMYVIIINMTKLIE